MAWVFKFGQMVRHIDTKRIAFVIADSAPAHAYVTVWPSGAPEPAEWHRANIEPIPTGDWRERWEEKSKHGWLVLYVNEQAALSVQQVALGIDVVRGLGDLIPRIPPAKRERIGATEKAGCAFGESTGRIVNQEPERKVRAMEHPAIKDAKDICTRYRKCGAIIVSFDGNLFHCASYGFTRAWCDEMRKVVDQFYKLIESEVIVITPPTGRERGEDENV
jgi:hypothetical protein